jgi:dihydrofolate synthase/folylpolyglutamate synthase
VAPDKLAATLEQVAPGKPYTIHSSAAHAWSEALLSARITDLVCVTGSVFLAGELRSTMLGLTERAAK